MRNKFNIMISLLGLLPVLMSAAEPQKDSILTKPWGESIPTLLSTGSANIVDMKAAESVPVTDLRNRLTGLIPGLEITQLNGNTYESGTYGSPELSSSGLAFASRGNSFIACIIDDVPIPFNQYNLDLNQIESIAFISDVADKAAIGPIASRGALYIKTAKGGYNTPLNIHADVESGIEQAGIWPEWVNGVEYAKLNNMAREGAGMNPLYSDFDLEGYASGSMNDVQYPNVDYKALMMRDTKPVTRFGFNANAGSTSMKYNFSLNGLNTNGMSAIGARDDYNALNLTTSITAKLGRYVEANASFMGKLAFRRSPTNYSFIHYRDTPAIAFPLLLKVDEDSPFYDPDIMGGNSKIFGVSRTFANNHYGEWTEGGDYSTRFRSGSFNASVDVDMSWLLKGLKARTFANLSTFYYQKGGKSEDYIAYFWNRDDIIEAVTPHVGAKTSEKSNMDTYTYQSLNLYERLSYDWSRNGHAVNAGATYYICSSANTSNSYYERQNYAVGNVKYSYRDKYIVDLVAQYAGSSRYYKDARYAWFPALGAAWVISNEDFLKDSRAVNYLKLRTQIGKVGDSDIYSSSNYNWQGNYQSTSGMSFGPVSANTWFGTNKYTSSYTKITRIANHDLTWTTLNEYDFGIDARFFGCLDLMANVFLVNRNGIMTDVTAQYPSSLGYSGTTLYANYNAQKKNGAELSLNFFKNYKDWGFYVGGNAMSYRVKYTKYANNVFAYPYQDVLARLTSDYMGFHCVGKFQSEDEIASSPLFSADTQTGDLKYEDKNDDGVIDSNDMYVVGNTEPLLMYAIRLGGHYKNFDLTVIGSGRAFYDTVLANDYFRNGWGDGNYSAFVRDNVGGDYPRISYYKSDNNFAQSDFWLTKGGYFKIQSVELAYNLRFGRLNWIDSARISLRGGNLATFTNVPYVDPESIDAGVTNSPIFRVFTAGVKINF